MKFFWKIYFSFTILILLAFGAFGTWMIHLSFDKSYQRVLGEAERENQMFQLSFEMNLNTLSDAYLNDGIIPVTAASIIQNLSDTGSIFLVYNSDQKLLYENKHIADFHDLLRASLDEEMPCGYQIQREGRRPTFSSPVVRSLGIGSIIWKISGRSRISMRSGSFTTTGIR